MLVVHGPQVPLFGKKKLPALQDVQEVGLVPVQVAQLAAHMTQVLPTME